MEKLIRNFRCPKCGEPNKEQIKEDLVFEIHDGNSDDFIVISGDSIEAVREQAQRETTRRGWADCWSCPIKLSSK